MPLRNARPVTIRPLGVTDTLDGTNAPPGSMTALTNLIPSQTTAGSWVCRPAAVQVADFASCPGVTSPGWVMPLIYAYNFVCGWVSDLTTGKDVPFVCFALTPTTMTFGTITGLGVSNANCPASVSQSAQADWEPPSATYLVNSVILTHPNAGTGAYRVSDFLTGVWAFERFNTAPTGFPAHPKTVSQMNGRVWYGCGSYLVYSDALAPKVVTNASQALNFANGADITAIGQLALGNPIVGGVVQSLIVFQSITAIQQVLGDAATSNLTTNVIKAGTGTLAPLTVVPTNKGIAFVAPDGLRFVTLDGSVTDPVGDQGTGVAVPFINATYPSHMCAAAAANVLRITTYGTGYSGEYWLDLARSAWSGPHTCTSLPTVIPAVQPVTPVHSTFYTGSFTGKMYKSDPVQSASSTYTEFGAALNFVYTTSASPDNEAGVANAIQVLTLTCSIPVGAQFSVGANFYGATGVNDGFSVNVPLAVSANATFFDHQVRLNKPMVSKQFSFTATGASAADVQIGNLYPVFQPQGYTIQQTI